MVTATPGRMLFTVSGLAMGGWFGTGLTVTVADAVPPRPSGMVYGRVVLLLNLPGAVYVTWLPPPPIGPVPLEGVVTLVTVSGSLWGSVSLDSTKIVPGDPPATLLTVSA